MMKQNMPVDPAPNAPGLTASLSGWRASATALAAALALAFPAGDALALSLGRINVLSALGEPLRAEIELPDLSATEAETLRTEIAPIEAFRAAGLEYSPALSNVRIQLQRRANGQSVLRLSSDTAVNDPFIDLILQATWASGRTVRDYTILLDPPTLRQPAPSVAVAPQVSTPTSPAARAPAPAVAQRAPVPSAIATPPAPARPPTAAPRPAPTPAPAPAAAAPSGDAQQQVVVKPGDTASRIATANKPASVSLDQMLVAMLRSNPDAFVRGNVNRMKAGAVLDVPSAAQASTTPAAEATQIITAQSRDFNAFRNRLAGNVPNVQVAGADRSASGRVQAQLEDKRSGATAPDKLTLSKGALKTQEAEEKIAREKAARDAADRVAELSKNISDLNKLGVASSAGAGTASATAPNAAASASGTTPTVTAPAAAPASSATSSAPTPAVTAATPAAPAPAAPAPAVSASKPKPAAVPAPVEASDSWMDSLRDNPLMPLAAAGLVALLAGFGVYRARQRKKAAELDSAFLESRLQPDSFFGASGGQHVDTSDDENGPASSMSYSPSQLDAAGDVDPVAEADVYLAYGRDLQAEEILKEALRSTPNRVAIHAKLLEIYAKRRDTASFGPLAASAFELTEGQGQDWERIAQLGRELDPDNNLYRTETGATDAGVLGTAHAALGSTMPTESAPLAEPATAPSPLPPAPEAAGTPATPTASVTPPAPARTTPESLDLDLDLDLTQGHLPERAVAAAAGAAGVAAMARHAAASPQAPQEAARPSSPGLDLDFNLDEHAEASTEPTATPLTVPAALDFPGQTANDNDALDFDIDLSSISEAGELAASPAPAFAASEPAALASAPAAPAPAAAADSGMIEFDLSSLTLDLGESTPGGAGAAEPEPDSGDPLATKLALAEEFSSIGDEDGARALAEEVLEEATGSLRARAQRFLSELSS